MPKADHTETFTEMRDRLIQVHNWGRRVASIAARYYLGTENCDDLRFRTQIQPCHDRIDEQPTLSLGEAHEIVMMR